ncbi:Pex24p-domain-containing protein [Polychaeton citri CBS 116435]|uniref:Pex24p-domain-containing protein n=1 Tax=Polychaeton citri CBS 116435 TaxID=1314669 RepID=A0A9P4URC6_9PEZI|nr:Pex24p-domain-containing protein [Polychaeton citri CBS 116435]
MDDEYSSSSSPIANRDDPIPVVATPSQNDAAIATTASVSDSEGAQLAGKRERARNKASNLKDQLRDGSAFSFSLQDRLLSGLMAQIIPPEDLSETETPSLGARKPTDRRSRKYVDRPGFSVALMGYNFRRFNARIGIAFVFQNRLIYLFTWRAPTQTLSFLAVYSLLCLKPELLPLVPLVLALFFVMVPAFLARHPSPEAKDPMLGLARFGPPMAAPGRIKPAPEMSKDFFRNMRDLQNCMEDFSRVHDTVNDYVTPYINFSDEATSSAIFLFLIMTASVAFLASQWVPWRVILLLTGWVAVCAGHPEAQTILLSSGNVEQVQQKGSLLASHLRTWVSSDIALDEPPETREVEVFELQKRVPDADEAWEPWLFTPTAYDPLSPPRIAGARPKGTQFFEDVQPPKGWGWKDKKWTLDLWGREWVETRMVTGVEVEMEGERWVYDVPIEDIRLSSQANRDKKRQVPRSGWEEGTGIEKRGEWRRRRWIRRVERKELVSG